MCVVFLIKYYDMDTHYRENGKSIVFGETKNLGSLKLLPLQPTKCVMDWLKVFCSAIYGISSFMFF
jgi:hypothetical protein